MTVVQNTRDANILSVDPTPRFELSPYLYMQFMEPLGTTEGSVEAAWDFLRDRWREDVVEVTKELAPTLIRWGGCFSSYYRWKEGVGPRARRKPMINLLWGGMESNQVGTHEFIDFCRQVGADPLLAVNFESDGRGRWAHPPKGGVRAAGPKEAAQWVDYCNNPSNNTRRRHGAPEPYGVRLWQIGNETSLDPAGYDCDTAGRRTLAFARAMHRVDPNIKLIGWGDNDWAPRMLEIAGEELQYLAYHYMFDPDSGVADSPLRGAEFRKDPARAWDHLMAAYKRPQARLQAMREQVAPYGVPLALTECHFALPGRNRCELLSTWAAGVANARILNMHERNGDILKIATLADFCGTRWQVNAIMIPTPRGKSYMMPVARVMSLYRRHMGQQAVEVTSMPAGLDVTASRTGRHIFLHIVNTHRDRSIRATLDVLGSQIASGTVFEIADDPAREIDETAPDLFAPQVKPLPDTWTWSFPRASVSAVELEVQLQEQGTL